MDPFTDTHERKGLLALIEGMTDPKEIETLINKYYPGWLVFSLSKYSPDYPHLQKNWEILCEKSLQVTPQKIVLVSDLKFDPDHSIINYLAEYMTKNGYAVRRMSEFVACPVCEGAIPTQDIWSMLRSKRFPVPTTWANKCQNC